MKQKRHCYSYNLFNSRCQSKKIIIATLWYFISLFNNHTKNSFVGLFFPDTQMLLSEKNKVIKMLNLYDCFIIAPLYIYVIGIIY